MNRYLYMIGRFGLGLAEHRVAVFLGALLWSGGRSRPLDVVHASPTLLARRGVSTMKSHATESTDRLVEEGILARHGARRLCRFQLRPEGTWRWPTGRYGLAIEELRSFSTARGAWGSDDRVDLARLFEPAVATGTGPTAHPWDPGFVAWLDAGLQLLNDYGPAAIEDAVAGWQTDHSAIPLDVRAFKSQFYALVQRGRRRSA